VEVKIGVQHTPRELSLDTDESQDDVEKKVAEAVSSGGLLVLSDTKLRRVVVPGEKISFVEIGSSHVGQVGFRS